MSEDGTVLGVRSPFFGKDSGIAFKPVVTVEAATSVTLTATADNQITGTSGADQTWNRGGFSLIAAGQGNQSGDLQRSLIKFDLTSIPAGSTISSATLQLTCVGQFSSTAYTVSAYKMLRVWSEGSSANGSYALNTDSSWTYASYSTVWGSPGADNTSSDRSASSIGSQSVSGCANSSVSFALDPSVVSAWADTPATNYGLIIVGNETSLQSTKNFASRENGVASYRPTLTVVYASSNPSPIVCGNGIVETGEQCDGSNLNGASCTTQGFTGGALSCSSCQFVTSACISAPTQTCGNGIVEGTEQCDGSNLNGASCSTQGFTGGTLACSGSCQFVTTQCTQATTGVFHVRTDGNDATCNGSANATTASAPNCAFKTIQKAVNSLSGPGNRIVIHAGTYPESVQITSGPNGVDGNPIVIEGDPSVPRTSVIIDSHAFPDTILINGSRANPKQYFVLQHFSFRTGTEDGIEAGVFDPPGSVGYAGRIVMRDLEVHSINFGAGTPYYAQVFTMQTDLSTPFGNDSFGLIEDVVVDNAENGSQFANGVGIFATSGNTTVRKTNIKDVKALGRMGNSVTLEFNMWEFSNCDSDGGCIQLYNDYGLLMRYNTIRVKNNIAAIGRVMETRCCAAGTSLASSPDFASAVIYNNVFDYQGTTEATAMVIDHGSQFASVRNNIFKGFKTTAGRSGAWSIGGAHCAKYEFKYNALYNSNLTRASTGCGTTLDPTNLGDTATIDFNTSTYTPNAGSRVINVGDPTLSVPINGGTRSDIGAYESGAGATWPYDFQIRDVTISNLPTLDWGNNSFANINIIPPYGFSTQTGYQCQIDTAMTFDSQGRGKPLYDSGTLNTSAATMCQSPTSLPNGSYYARVRFRNEVVGIASYAGVWSDHYYKFNIAAASSGSVCGNGIVETGEQCDGTNLAGASCTSKGFADGTLSCSSLCQFVTSACTTSTTGGGGMITGGGGTAGGGTTGGGISGGTTGGGSTSTNTGLPTGTGNSTTGNTSLTQSEIDVFIAKEKALLNKIDLVLVNRLLGRILLQVQSHGESWYLDPISKVRYYLANGIEAYEALRKFGLGITDADIAKIPAGIESRFQETDSDGDGLPDKMEEGLGTDVSKADTDGDGFSDGVEVASGHDPLGPGTLPVNAALVNRLKGRIVVQVQKQGQAWYIDPVNGKRYYLHDGEAAYQIMRFLSLGITDADLEQIGVGSLR